MIGRRRPAVGEVLAGWPLAAGRWPLAAGRWPLAAGRWPLAAGRWPLAVVRLEAASAGDFDDLGRDPAALLRRQFGAPPSHDAARLRQTVGVV